MNKNIVIGKAALSDEIFAGYLCKDGRTWKQGKVPVTSQVLQAIIDFVGVGYETDVTVNGKPKYTIRVTEYKPEEETQ
jgi:hypothetical protein